MNVFEYAMKMEEDGRKYYEEQAGNATSGALKRIWQQLAEDEIKHYEIFRRFRDGEVSTAAKMAAAGTKILDGAKTVFSEMSENDKNLTFSGDELAAWEKAKQLEVDTQVFYREKANEATDDEVKKSFNLLADEENKHQHLIEHVMDFLREPRQWLDDAEWSNLGQY
jgi:rubrerythrin